MAFSSLSITTPSTPVSQSRKLKLRKGYKLLKVTQQVAESELRSGLAFLQPPPPQRCPWSSMSMLGSSGSPAWGQGTLCPAWSASRSLLGPVPLFQWTPYLAQKGMWSRMRQEHSRKTCCGRGRGGWRRRSTSIYFSSSYQVSLDLGVFSCLARDHVIEKHSANAHQYYGCLGILSR